MDRGGGGIGPVLLAAAGLAGLLGLAALAGTEPVLRAWYVAAATWAGVPVGCLALLIVNHILRREVFLATVLERGCRLLLPAGLAFLPVLAFPAAIFPWADPGFQPAGPVQAAWLTEGGFALRTAILFALWIALAELLIHDGRSVAAGHRRPWIAIAGAGIYAVTVTVAGVDWVMTLDPDYASSAFGFALAAHQILMALGFAVLADRSFGARSEAVPVAQGLLVGGALLWGLFVYLELMVIRSGGVPAMEMWYADRAGAGWVSLRGLVAGLVVLGVGLALATGPRGGLLRPAALCLMASQVLEALWQLLPALGTWTAGPGWLAGLYLLALVTVAASGLALYLRIPAPRSPPEAGGVRA